MNSGIIRSSIRLKICSNELNINVFKLLKKRKSMTVICHPLLNHLNLNEDLLIKNNLNCPYCLDFL